MFKYKVTFTLDNRNCHTASTTMESDKDPNGLADQLANLMANNSWYRVGKYDDFAFAFQTKTVLSIRVDYA